MSARVVLPLTQTHTFDDSHPCRVGQVQSARAPALTYVVALGGVVVHVDVSVWLCGGEVQCLVSASFDQNVQKTEKGADLEFVASAQEELVPVTWKESRQNINPTVYSGMHQERPSSTPVVALLFLQFRKSTRLRLDIKRDHVA